ncbi:MAG: LUD domain-containing protein [Oceanihabitans sp.]
MSLFRKIFGSKSNKEESELKKEQQGKYMPEIKLPIDERFTTNFKSNGGKFLYCENFNEILNCLQLIIEENSWQDASVLLLDNSLEEKFNSSNLNPSKDLNTTDYFLTTCEGLIADNGSLLISSNQIAEKKLDSLPKHFIVFATTSQIIENIGEGLRIIKNKNKQKIPSNITTIKHFKSSDEKDFLTYGSSSKNLYLLLLEDL